MSQYHGISVINKVYWLGQQLGLIHALSIVLSFGSRLIVDYLHRP